VPVRVGRDRGCLYGDGRQSQQGAVAICVGI
jgi:hypothetical protein